MTPLTRRKKTVATLCGLALLTATGLLGGCKEAEYKAPPPTPVTVSKPVVQDVTIYADYTGYTQAYESVDLRARVEGFLKAIHYTPGDYVKQDQLLFEIDPEQYIAKRDEAEGNLAQAVAQMKLAHATMVRKERAYKDRAVSEVEVIEAKAQYAEATAAIKSAQANLETAKINLGYTKITSPIEGRITRNMVDVGNLVGAGQMTLLANVVDDDPMYVYFNVSGNDLLGYMKAKEEQGMQEGLRQPEAMMALRQDGDYPFKGILDYMDNKVDTATGTIQVRGVFDNKDHKIIPGLFARIRLPLKTQKNAVLVPDTAIGTDLGGKYMLVVDKDNKAEYRKLKVGPLYGQNRLIIDGIKPDDTIVINGMQKVRPGSVVTPMTEEQVKQAQEKEKAAQAQKKAAAEKAGK